MYNRYLERVRVHFTNAYSKGRNSVQILTAKIQPRVNSFMQQNAASAKVKLSGVQKSLDEFFKIKDVTEAQLVVTDTEKQFLEARRLSRKAMKDLSDAEVSLEEARKKLDRCPRENENFYKYFSEEHELFMNKKKLKVAHEASEQLEREIFTEYSNAVRISHEKERERAQTTKYWSIIGSISGAIIGQCFFFHALAALNTVAPINPIQNVKFSLQQVCTSLTEAWFWLEGAWNEYVDTILASFHMWLRARSRLKIISCQNHFQTYHNQAWFCHKFRRCTVCCKLHERS